MYILDISVKHHLLHLRPLDLLGRDAGIVEQHPADKNQQCNVKNGREINSYNPHSVFFILGFLSHLT